VLALRWTRARLACASPPRASMNGFLPSHVSANSTARPSPPMALKKHDLSPVKHYILDTKRPHHDPQSMFQFEDNVVWLPVEVLEELIAFKAESTTRGANAREVHRKLSERFPGTEQMKQGVPLENGGRLHVCINPNVRFDRDHWELLSESPRYKAVRTLFPDLTSTDNRILGERRLSCGYAKRPHDPRHEGSKYAAQGARARA
jgi:hypothetical protein